MSDYLERAEESRERNEGLHYEEFHERRAEDMTLAERYESAVREWRETGSADSADALAEVENALCDHLDIPLDETEQGLTPYAQALIDAYLGSGGE